MREGDRPASGYAIEGLEYKIVDGKYQYELSPLGNFCLPGNKANFSFDERFIATHQYVDHTEPDQTALPEGSSNIVLADPNVSRNLAEIRPQGDGFVLVDLGSTNGSKVNGMRVDQRMLADGDEIMFGNTRMRFEAS